MDRTSKATLAGGCFWGMEDLIRQLSGVLDTTVGYTGGHLENPTYKDICTGTTGHAEAIEIIFDSTIISYHQILHFFFRIHNPTTINQQGNDIGTQYRSAIFYHNLEQLDVAKQVIGQVNELKRFNGNIVTQVEEAMTFWPAEVEHQDYLQKYPNGYTCHYIRP